MTCTNNIGWFLIFIDILNHDCITALIVIDSILGNKVLLSRNVSH